MGKEGGGPIYNPGCQLTAPKEMNGLPPKPHPISQLPRNRRDRTVTSKIQGADYHPGFQQIAFADTETGELQERRLEHAEEAEKFYRDLGAQGACVRIGMEASLHARWFERLLSELKFELWIGDAAEIATKRVRKQKTDRQDAELILQLLMDNRFPQIWVPSWENRDLRQLLWHRHRMVQARTRIMNQLQAMALNEGLLCKKRLWRETGRKQMSVTYGLLGWTTVRKFQARPHSRHSQARDKLAAI